MNFRLALGGLVCLGLASGSAFAVTAEASAPAAPIATSAPDESPDASAAPEQDDNPYSAIVRANVFHLQEPPKPPEKPNETLLNLPKVNITGFRKRNGEPLRALFATVPKDPKEPPKYFNLAEGEKEDILELKKIDPDQESVDVIVAGTPTTLTVKSNSFVQPIIIPKGGPVAMANPVARPPMAAVPQAVNPANYGQGNNEGNNGGVIVAGGSVVPTAPSPAAATPGVPHPAYGGGFAPNTINNPGVNGGTPVTTGGESALRSIPTRGIRTSTPNYNQPQ